MRARVLMLVLVLLTVPAAAQDVTLKALDEDLGIHGGEGATAVLHLASYTAGQAYHVRLQVSAPGNWEAALEPHEVVVGPGSEVMVRVDVSAAKHPSPRHVPVTVEAFVVGDDFTTFQLSATVNVTATGTEQVLGRWDNPLPTPLDGAWGSFLVNVVVWGILSALTMWAFSPAMKLLTLRTKSDIDDRFIRIVSRPAFVLVFTFGIKQSLEVFALPLWLFTGLDRLWQVVLALIIVYVVYRLWREIILSVGKRVAKQTESELDDVLYPVFEKIGSVIILIVGLFYIVSSFGVNMTVFAAGGAVLSLVIAFAAQDTLGNFFSGLFILLDRPFRVGDRIELPEQQHWGDVQRIGLRTTSVRTQDNRMVVFPNSVIGSNAVINHSYPDPLYRIQVDFKLPYGSDVEWVRKTLVEAVKPVDGVNAERAPEALLLEFTEQGQGWRLRWWINSYTDTRRAFDRVNSAVIKEMAKHNIRIQYQPLTIWDAHKLLARDSAGGLSPEHLTAAERSTLEQEAEASRQKAERQERDEIEATKRKARAAAKKKGQDPDEAVTEADAEE